MGAPEYNICHKIIYTTFSYLYTKQCNNTFIHIFMSLENTFVTVILSRYLLLLVISVLLSYVHGIFFVTGL